MRMTCCGWGIVQFQGSVCFICDAMTALVFPKNVEAQVQGVLDTKWWESYRVPRSDMHVLTSRMLTAMRE